jgi:hypothetical protein
LGSHRGRPPRLGRRPTGANAAEQCADWLKESRRDSRSPSSAARLACSSPGSGVASGAKAHDRVHGRPRPAG